MPSICIGRVAVTSPSYANNPAGCGKLNGDAGSRDRGRRTLIECSPKGAGETLTSQIGNPEIGEVRPHFFIFFIFFKFELSNFCIVELRGQRSAFRT